MPADTLIFVIPVYQPDAALLPLLRELTAATDHPVLLVDDGSSPVFHPLFEEARQIPSVRLLRHEKNRGKGAALRTAFAWIAENHPEISGIVTADADGQHAVADILAIGRAVIADPAAIHLGSRAFNGAGVPLKSRLGNLPMRLIFRLFTGRKIADTQTGLRAIPAELAAWLTTLPGDRYEFELAVLIAAPQLGYPLREHPIRVIYHRNNRGSHFHPLRDSLRVFAALFRRHKTVISDAGMHTRRGPRG